MNRNNTHTQHTASEPAPVVRGPRKTLAAFMAVSAALLLAACDKPAQEPTVGQRIDSAVAQAGEKTDDAVEAARQGAESARTTAGEAVQAASETMKDAAITTGVNAALARDDALSALKIDVDTTDGRVVLRGEAPSAEARERATQLAQAVDGVAAVDNQLMIRN